jgi:hypothetical protein
VREVRDQCLSHNVAFFFSLRPKSGGRTLDNREWKQRPSMTEVAAKTDNGFWLLRNKQRRVGGGDGRTKDHYLGT